MKRACSLLLVSLLCFSMMFATACVGDPAESNVGGSSDIGDVSNVSTTTNGDTSGDNSTSDGTGTTTVDPSATTTGSDNSGSTTGGSKTNGTTGGSKTNSTKTTATSSYVKDTSARNLKGRTLIYTVYWEEGKKGSSASANAYWKNKEALEAKFNCKIKHVFKGRDAIDNEVIPSIMSGDPITDVMCIVADRLFNYAKKGLIYPLDTLKQFDFNEDKWNQGSRETSTFLGHTYGMIATQKPYVNGLIVYNKELFEAKGLDDPFELQKKGKKAWNWDSFRKLCKDITGNGVYGLGHYGIPGDGVGSFFSANDASMVTRDENGVFKSSIVSKKLIDAMQYYQDMRVIDKSIPDLTGNEAGKELFLAGKLGFYMAGGWEIFPIAERADFELGLVLTPAGPDSNLEYAVSTGSGNFYCMPSNIKNPEDVAAVMDGYIGSDAGTAFWEDVWFDMFYSEEVLETLRLGEKLIAEGKFVKGNFDGFIPDKYELGYFTQWNAVAQGQMTPAQAVEAMQSVIQSAVDKLNKN